MQLLLITFIVLSATSGGVCIITSVSFVRAAAGIAGASFTLILSLTTGIIKTLHSITRNKKKKHDKILMLAKSKHNSIKLQYLKHLFTWK